MRLSHSALMTQPNYFYLRHDLTRVDLRNTESAEAFRVLLAAAAVGAEHRAVCCEEYTGVTESAVAILDYIELAEGLAVIGALSNYDRCSAPTPFCFISAVVIRYGIVDGVKRVSIVPDDLHRGIGRGENTRLGGSEAK